MHSLALLALLPLALAAPAKRAQPAPIIQPRGAQVLPGKYIVKFKQGTPIDETVNNLPVEPDHIYDGGAFTGFASTLGADTLSDLQNHPEVRHRMAERRM